MDGRRPLQRQGPGSHRPRPFGHLAVRDGVPRLGGLIGFVHEGDIILIDVPSNPVDLQVDDATLAARKQGRQPNAPLGTTGVLGKYARLVQGGETGAIANTL